MSFQYFVTAHKSTAVTACSTGKFTSENHLNLILAKNSSFEIFLVGPEGLRLLKEVNINGRISVSKLFRPKSENQDLLFIVTSKLNAMILGCQMREDNKVDLHTRSYGNLAETIGDVSSNGILAVIDHMSKIIGLRLYDGLLKIITIEKITPELKYFNIRINEIEVEDLNFLFGRQNPTFIILYRNSNGQHIKTYELSLRNREFFAVPWRQDNIAIDVSFLIPVPEPICGVIIVGKDSVVYHDGMRFITVEPSIIRDNSIICYANVDNDGCRYVLGDSDGHLFIFFLEKDTTPSGNNLVSVKDVKIEILGEVSIPECITYLDNGVLFIGSRLGDSQLVKLNSEINPETGSYVTIMGSFTNLAPIIDMVVVDLEKQGQRQLITCSGGRKEGSLRIIRNGIGIQELATFEMSGIKDIWTLRIRTVNEYDNAIVLSFVGHTRILLLHGDEIEETELSGFQSDFQTMFCGNITISSIIQVVPQSIRLISTAPNEIILSEWKIPSGKNISVVTSNKNQIICASGPELYYIEIYGNNIVQKTSLILEFEVSCLGLSSFPDEEHSEFIAVGLWSDVSCRVLRTYSLEELHREYLGGDIISRSILFASLEDVNYVFCALGDGTLFYFNFDRVSGQLIDKKRVTLGIQPLKLIPFNTLNTSSVFVCSDKPTIIYSNNSKMVFSNINLKEVSCMCSLNSETYKESIILSTESVVIIGIIEDIKKLHIRSVSLGETPRRIAHQECSETLGVLSARKNIDGNLKYGYHETASTRAQTITNSQQSSLLLNRGDGENIIEYCPEADIYSFLLIDQHTFEVIHAHQMIPSEFCLSLITAQLGNDINFYYIIGTAILRPGESEPKCGRIIIFHVNERKLQQIAEKEVKGACYSLVEFNGKLLACVNSTVRLFHWTEDKHLALECSYFNNITALYVKTKGDFVLIGDIMRAITLLRYKIEECRFEEISRDYNPKWMTAVEILDDDTFLGAENYLNLFVCQKDSSATNEEDRRRMTEVCQFHLGDMVNIFRHGSLVMRNLVNTITSCETVLFGTVSGLIGIVLSIPQNLYETLMELQKHLSSIIQPVGFIEHSFWRSFSSDVKTQMSYGFIDGDLIEAFLDLKRKEMLDVINGMKVDKGFGMKEDVDLDEIIKIVEDLTRIH